jgi:hypothetical protein
VPGDSAAASDQVVKALTQGSKGAVDIQLMQEYIDNASEDVQYIKEWRTRRAQLPHLMRVLDVRVFSLPPNVSVLAARAFGEKSVKDQLTKRNVATSAALSALKATRLYKEIASACGIEVSKYAGLRSVKAETEDEYLRIQKLAASNDKPLNKALGGCLESALLADGFTGLVTKEKKNLPQTGLQPDILVQISNKNYICIEPTWRSTGRQIGDEIEGRQATLTEAHIKKYVMDKALEFVKAYDF